MATDNFYRMMILLEEPHKQHSTDGRKIENASHDFVDELLLPIQVDDLEVLNTWFDKFDEEICIPNEGHIKYEISSDGLIVLILDKEISEVIGLVRDFVAANQLDEDSSSDAK
ncbi:AAL184Wp [Eremothecium gossypii ATCC 10895]|uniref:AAL184Wp n=1 Tax=Eremothecium gossypii (strain ATCC 10895 / CBS 109.51 / FGSC 9923 / NRRL Y-1056) TaxID=284811 RepID=Q75FB5_EREGS|nr:AAL184Wp [Eremothecium gossypii ATCC 10895]AAS50182.1 AAL184Wp [Eremothecium gossypii ATCC 10895]AEY94467.1 FAAL184Wp [Eremothecium gossypii FDAG1]